MTYTQGMALTANSLSDVRPQLPLESTLPTRNYAEAELSLRALVENMSEATIEVGTIDKSLIGIDSSEEIDGYFAQLNKNLEFLNKLSPPELAKLNENAAHAVADAVDLEQFIAEGAIVVTPFFTILKHHGKVSFTLNSEFYKDETNHWIPKPLIPIHLDITHGRTLPTLPTPKQSGKGGNMKWLGFTVLLLATSAVVAFVANSGKNINTDVQGGDGMPSAGLNGGAPYTHEVPEATYTVPPTSAYTPAIDLLPSPTATLTEEPIPENTPTPEIETVSFPLSSGENLTMNSYSADQGNSAMDEVINIEGCKTNIDRFDQVNPEFDTIFNQVLMQIPGLGRNEISYVNYEDQQTGEKYRMIVYEISNSEDGQPQTVIVYLNRNNEVKTVLIRDKFITVYESIKGYSRDGRLVNPYTVIIN
jgi:hypothetical protein